MPQGRLRFADGLATEPGSQVYAPNGYLTLSMFGKPRIYYTADYSVAKLKVMFGAPSESVYLHSTPDPTWVRR